MRKKAGIIFFKKIERQIERHKGSIFWALKNSLYKILRLEKRIGGVKSVQKISVKNI